MKHHTKDKGDQGLGFVIADLLKNGIQSAILLSEHLPFDCIAISQEMVLKKLSVKYRSAVDDKIDIDLRSKWADGEGSHSKDPDLSVIDGVAVYCPDTERVYYIRPNEFKKSYISLRLTLPANNQKKGIHMAIDFEDPLRIFTAP